VRRTNVGSILGACITMSFTLKGRANKKPSGSKIITSILTIVMRKLRSQKKKFCLFKFLI
jgi:hypothetical protein